MEKYLVSIEFRYEDAPKHEDDFTCRSNTVTIGVYNTFEIACAEGNTLLSILESRFELHKFPDGRTAQMERFSKNGGPFGEKKTLVTNSAYLKTPFVFFAKIKTLKFRPIDEVITEVVDATERYKNYRQRED